MHIATLVAKEYSPNQTVAYLTFATETHIPFLEGQFMMLFCPFPDGSIQKKPYSIASISSDENHNHISFLIKSVSQGGCSEHLVTNLQIGESISIKGPVGHFLNRKVSKNYLFVSIGSGLAPCLSIYKQLLQSGEYNRIAFLFGERSEESIPPSLYELCKNPPHNVQINYFLTQPVAPSFPYTVGRIDTGIDAALAYIGLHASTFLCGKPEMVTHIQQTLISSGMSTLFITTEKY